MDYPSCIIGYRIYRISTTGHTIILYQETGNSEMPHALSLESNIGFREKASASLRGN